MLRSAKICAAVFGIVCLSGLVVWCAVWSYNRSEVIVWDGGTTLHLDFQVVDAQTEEPIPNSKIEIREHNRSIAQLETDHEGRASHFCESVWVSGRIGRLRFIETRHVIPPCYEIAVITQGYPPEWVDLCSERPDKVVQGPDQNRLAVRVALSKRRR